MFDVNIYIETTLKSANIGTGKYGFVVEYITHKNEIPITRTGMDEAEETTANQLLLIGCIRALELLTKSCQIKIYLDSTYIANGINKWIKDWHRNGWKTAKGDPVKNLDLWMPFYELSTNHLITVENVKTHSYSGWIQEEMKKELAAV